MLQRAASNAYSWWWASHIRTDQSKWLDNNLQEMEDRVKSMLKIIEEDADSFAKRAEMYYKRRPELLSFVEETYKAYRALAERYDRISGELHKANHTLATAFPDVQFSMPDDEDDDNFPSESNTSTDSIDQAHRLPPEVPPINMINKKSVTKLPSKKPGPMTPVSKASEAEAKELIDRLQKGILVLQTEKEFIKSSYESGIAKYWEIEKQITEMQEEVCSLQDEFSASTVIEDDEARALMAVTALKSCQDTIVNLQEQQKRSIEETRVESARIKIAKEKFKALKGENGELEKEIVDCSEARRTEVELKTICDKVKDHLAISAETSVVELAEKIDELVNKVIGLELTVSSQTAQITNLRSETDCLQKHLRGFEEEKMSPIDDPADHLRDRMNQVEDDLVKLASPSQDDEISFLDEESQIDHVEREIIKTEAIDEGTSGFHELSPILKEHKEDHIESNPSVTHPESNPGKPLTPQTSNPDDDSDQQGDQDDQQGDQDDAPNLKQLLLNGLEGREKVFLGEYMSILRNYKDTKNKLLEVEKKNQEYFSETMSQVRELKSENAVKDDEIRSLRQILTSIQTSSNLNRVFSESPKPQPPEELKQYGVVDEEATGPTSIASPIEEKFRKEIDTLLDENLEFWLRFSTSFHQIQRFRNDFQILQEERERGVNVAEKLDKLPFEKQLRELKTELQVWVEQNSLLRGELKSRFSSLCSIQEDISEALKASLVDDNVRFTPYQAAKFQGEVLNMKQENNKVADELQAGMDHVTGLQAEVERALSKLQERFEPRSGSGAQQGHNRNFLHFSSKSRGVPLRSFLYGVKPKKPSIFSCMNPALQKQYSDLRAGHPT